MYCILLQFSNEDIPYKERKLIFIKIIIHNSKGTHIHSRQQPHEERHVGSMDAVARLVSFGPNFLP